MTKGSSDVIRISELRTMRKHEGDPSACPKGYLAIQIFTLPSVYGKNNMWASQGDHKT